MRTEFTSAEVSFRGADFAGGEVDLAHCETPPEFYSWERTPQGLTFPSGWGRLQARSETHFG